MISNYRPYSIALLCVLLASAQNPRPSIEFTVVPPSGNGGSVRVDPIEGRVKGAAPGQRIVLYAQSGGTWWVQPLASQPFTEIQANSRFQGMTHPGTRYAALLVDSRYTPASKMAELPEKGGGLLAMTTVVGPAAPQPKTIEFSGYPWTARDGGRHQSGQFSFYDSSNVWADEKGLLHLRVTKRDGKWMCAEATLPRSLGYGAYRFVVRDVSRLEPAAVLIIGPSSKMALELSRWGRPEDKNAQYVIVPYTIPENTIRFAAVAGTLTHWMNWGPGRVTFRTVRGLAPNPGQGTVAEHSFTSGIPSPDKERISLNLYVLDNASGPLKQAFEVIVEKFEFLP